MIRRLKKTTNGTLALTLAFALAVGLALVCAAGIVWADSPHYLKGTAATFNDDDACLYVDVREAGLGNSGLSSITYLLTCDATFEAVCVTKQGNNFVQGQPKSGSGTATVPTTIAIRNGSTRGTITLCPSDFTLPNPGCTGSQRLFIISAEYTNCDLDDQLGTPSPLDPNQTFGGDVFILVP